MASTTYKLLKTIGFNYSETEYGDISLWKVIKKTFITMKNAILLGWFMESALLSPILPRFLRPKILTWIGCKMGKNIFIGASVTVDSGHADLIEMEDHVHIAGHSILLCHQRDLSHYCVGDDYAKLGYKLGKITLKKGCLVGTNCMIMPGVTIGEGAIVGAFSLVTKDIPAWTIATGRPAKVVKQIQKKTN
ncbi:MAG: acyltransferase [Candidatus Symbiothrix sp.]|jgi:acetyltransferase-like isoleucine patch superfamily enzyme|nr:acyltransferase [Candidatus Symbiothrix sp.]